MKRLITLVILTMIVFSFVYYNAFADNVNVNVTVPQARTMTVPASININATVGSEATQNLSITGVKTNCAYTLSVKKDTGFNAGNGDLYSSNATYTIPSSKFKFTSTAQGTPIEFTGTDQTVRSGSKTGETGVTENVTYRLSVDYGDEAASDYAARHIYTLGS